MDFEQPTPSELSILSLLWKQGPSSVKQVHAAWSNRQEVGYTTILKFMQVMHQKGLLKRDTTSRAHIYEAAISEEVVQSQIIQNLLEGPFLGSAKNLVLRALSVSPSTPDELAEIKKLIEEMERNV